MRIYAFGARPPVENIELVRQQLSLAHSYQCALVAIERDRRAAVDAAYASMLPSELAALESAENRSRAAAERVGQCRSLGGDTLPPDEEMVAERREALNAAKTTLEAAREAEKAARVAWWEARKRVTPELRPLLRTIDDAARVANKRAYNLAGDVGLAWGTRLKIGEFVERAAKASAKAGTLPKFPRFDGGGMIAVQLQGDSGIGDKKGLSPADALGGEDTRFRLESVSIAAWMAAQGKSALVSKKGAALDQPDPNSGRSKRRLAVAIARVRVGSDGRAPVWAAWPVVVSRQLPPEAPIKWVQLHASRIGSRLEWRLLITVDDAEVPAKDGTKTVAVNFGWRNLPDGGLRVGYAVGSDGREEEIRVPPDYISGVGRVESLRAIRDQRLEGLKRDLAEWTDDAGDSAPEWLAETLRYVDQWRSPRRAAILLRRWRTRRFAGDSEIFNALVFWEKKDRHLRFWECDKRERLLRRRKEHYRCFAARLAQEYDRVLVTDMDLRDFAALPAPEEAAKSEGSEQRRSRFLAAPSELRGAIKNACSTRGTAFEEAKSTFKTQTCNACGLVQEFEARATIKHACECGARWDQDANHCRNLLASDPVLKGIRRAARAVGEEGDQGAADKKKGRWQKRRSKTVVQDSNNGA